MKHSLVFVLFATLIFSACAPASIPTPAPSATLLPTIAPSATPSPTPTATPTATPTPLPTLPPEQLGGLTGVPDPRATNPQLFDLKRPDTPIVQFAKAFGIKPEEVGDLTPRLLTGADGRQFVVLTTGDLPQTPNFIETGIPLLIAEQGENGEWEWGRTTLKNLANKLGIKIGTEGSGWLLNNDKSLNLAKLEVNIVIPTYPQLIWKDLQPSSDNKINETKFNKIIQQWGKNGFGVILPAILPVKPSETTSQTDEMR